MRPVFVHLDHALHAQEALGGAAAPAVVHATDLGPALRLWARPRALDEMRRRLRDLKPDAGAPDLVFCGSGDFHHLTLLLLERVLEREADPVTLLHFDNHPDWVKFSNGVHCGSWAARAARLPKIARVITMGPCSDDIDKPGGKGADLSVVEDGRLELYPFRAPQDRQSLFVCGREWPSLQSLGPDAFADMVIARIDTPSVYVTIDKDVLARADAVTNWDQGELELKSLLFLLARLAARRRLVGADIVGDWSPPAYGDGLVSAMLKQGEALLDQPWSQPDPSHARAVNERANLELLDFFRQAA